jgi:hypothetical protein
LVSYQSINAFSGLGTNFLVDRAVHLVSSSENTGTASSPWMHMVWYSDAGEHRIKLRKAPNLSAPNRPYGGRGHKSGGYSNNIAACLRRRQTVLYVSLSRLNSVKKWQAPCY